MNTSKSLIPHQLVVITGPVGGGKSTTAFHLAIFLRERGLCTAVVDLDDVFCMARQRTDDNCNEPEVWTAAAELIGREILACFRGPHS